MHTDRAPGEHRNLTPAVTCDRVGLTKHTSYPLTDLLQQPISGFMTQAILHVLETGKVEKQDGSWFHLSLPRSDRFLQTLSQECLDRQPRQSIEYRGELRLRG